MVKKITQILIVMVLLFTIPLMANALTLVWDTYTDTVATELRIYTSPTGIGETWTELVVDIPTNNVASEIPDGADNTRVYYMIRAVDELAVPNEALSGNSNVVSYFWTTDGNGYGGPSAVGGVSFINCDEYDNIVDDGTTNWDICNERHNKPSN